MPGTIRVLVADDSPAIRKAISALLGNEPYLQLCGEAEDYPELLRKMDECRPDVVVMDVRMPGEGKVDGETFKAHLRGSCLLAISFAKDQSTVRLAETCGAFKLLDKVELGTSLIPAIRECVQQSGNGLQA